MAQTYKICLLPGDGIGPEIIAEGVKVLDAIAAKYGVSFEYTEALIGGRAIDETGRALPEATLAIASGSDAVLLAAVGGPKWDTTDPSKPRPEQGLLAIRKGLGLYANLRPVVIFNALADASTLKPSVIDGVDCVIVRELTGGLYFGERERTYDVAGAGVNGAPGQQAGRAAVPKGEEITDAQKKQQNPERQPIQRGRDAVFAVKRAHHT